MTTTNLKYTREDVCDNLALPYSVEDYILFDSIGNQLVNGDETLINERDNAYDEVNDAKETIRELKDKVSKLEEELKDKETELNDVETDLWNAEQELDEYKHTFGDLPKKVIWIYDSFSFQNIYSQWRVLQEFYR